MINRENACQNSGKIPGQALSESSSLALSLESDMDLGASAEVHSLRSEVIKDEKRTHQVELEPSCTDNVQPSEMKVGPNSDDQIKQAVSVGDHSTVRDDSSKAHSEIELHEATMSATPPANQTDDSLVQGESDEKGMDIKPEPSTANYDLYDDHIVSMSSLGNHSSIVDLLKEASVESDSIEPKQTEPSMPPDNQANNSLVQGDSNEKGVDTSQQQLPCQPEVHSNIEAVVEMLLENSEHLSGLALIIEQANHGKRGSTSNLGVTDKCEGSESSMANQYDEHVSEPIDQLECVEKDCTETSKRAENDGQSALLGGAAVEGSSNLPGGSGMQGLSPVLVREDESDSSVVKNTRCQKTEESKPDLVKRHKCPECGKLFPRANSLKRHILLHMDDRPYRCTECDADYKSYSQLKRHMRLHTGEKPAKCEHCDKTFRTYNELYVHRRTHTGEKPFECKYCGKSFSTRGYRNTHERIHTGEKRFECDFCEMKFTESSARRVHRFTHTGETPYKCEVCGRGFTQAGNLSKHVKTLHSKDKPFKCQECDKVFAVKQELTRHFSRIHSSNKPHECKECGKKYAIQSDLTQHMNTHKNRCSNCGTKFKDKKELERHILEDCLIPGYISPPPADSSEDVETNSDALNTEPARSRQRNVKQKRKRKSEATETGEGTSCKKSKRTVPLKSAKQKVQSSKTNPETSYSDKRSLLEDWGLDGNECRDDANESSSQGSEATQNMTNSQDSWEQEKQVASTHSASAIAQN